MPTRDSLESNGKEGSSERKGLYWNKPLLQGVPVNDLFSYLIHVAVQ